MTNENASEAKETIAQESAAGAGAGSEGKTPAPKRRKRGIVIGVVAAVVVVAGAGLLVWHEQPSFCAAICHTPMDAYYETYADGSVDKLGNQIDATAQTSMLSFEHKNINDITCLGCHVPTLGEQVSEGIDWLTGDYAVNTRADGTVYLESRTLADLTEARGIDEVQFCLNDDCHASTPDREALAKRTERLGSEYNPHLERHGEIDCGTCHKAHTQSVNYCTDCHASAPVPDGWLTMEQAREMGVVA